LPQSIDLDLLNGRITSAPFGTREKRIGILEDKIPIRKIYMVLFGTKEKESLIPLKFL
jgi:hypothetical protein